MVGKRLIGKFASLHRVGKSHARNVPWGHTHGQVKCATRVLQGSSPFCDNVPMAAHRHFIRQWRKFRGLTQEQLADRIGISRPQLSKVEKGARKYDQAFLEAAAEELRCDVADLLVRDPTAPEGIWSIWDTLNPVERAQVVEVAKALKRTGTNG